MTGPAKRVAIYARVSTDDQVEGSSLDTQLERCRSYVSAQGWSVAGEYIDEGVSGTRASRPALDRLMAVLRSGQANVVVVAKLDRLGRSVRHLSALLGELDDLGVPFVSVAEAIDGSTPSGRLQRSLLASFAEFERDRIKERTAEGIIAVAREGFWPSGEPPFGYWTRREGRRRSRAVINEQEAATIRKAVECIVDHAMSTWQTADELNALGMRPRKASRWTGARLRYVLMNGSALSGKWAWRKGRSAQTITIEVPSILTPERHEALKTAMARTGRAAPRQKHFYLLAGRIVSPCGGRMHGWTTDGVRGASAGVYKCPLSWSSVPKDERCGCRPVRQSIIDTAVWVQVTKVLSRPQTLMAGAREALDAADAAGAAGSEDLAALDRRIARLERAAGQQVAQLLASGMDPTVAQHAVAALTADLDGLRNHRGKLIAWASANADRTSRAERLLHLAAKAAEVLAEPTDDVRRRIIDALDVQVSVTGWEPCQPCEGSGWVQATFAGPRQKGQPRRVICPACLRTGRTTLWSITGEVPATLLDPVEPPAQPQPGWPFRVVSDSAGA